MANFIKSNLKVFKFSQKHIKKFQDSKDSKSVLIFSPALEVVDF